MSLRPKELCKACSFVVSLALALALVTRVITTTGSIIVFTRAILVDISVVPKPIIIMILIADDGVPCCQA